MFCRRNLCFAAENVTYGYFIQTKNTENYYAKYSPGIDRFRLFGMHTLIEAVRV